MAPHQPIQLPAAVVGVVFLLVGILGFIPGVATNHEELSFAGHQAGALLGVFAVSVLHNIVHIAFGLAGLVMSRTTHGAVTFLVGGGAVYLLLWLYGTVIDHNTADNWLHLGLGVGMVALGLLSGRIK